eukprot:293462_1
MGIKRRSPQYMNGSYYCYRCNEWKSCIAFYKDRLTECKVCKCLFSKQYANTLRGFVTYLVLQAKYDSKRRQSSNNDTRGECTTTMDDVFEILEEQMFRCYSAIPMTFKRNMDWRCSLERMDNMKGYTKDNCVLICWEFNSTDRTVHAVNPVLGSSQWNQEKFTYFYKTRFGN